jgi:integrase
MASVCNDPGGRKRILFVDPDGNRKPIRLGKMSIKDAESIARHVDALLAAKASGQAITLATATWLADIGETLHARLAAVGLITARETMVFPTVSEFIEGYLRERGDLKPATLTVMQQARVWLVRFVGADKRLDQVTVADADGYKAHMVASKLAKATIAKRCRYARHFFAVAMRRKLVTANPFEHITGAVKGDPARRMFVPGETVAKIIESLPDAQWRLLVALARWGGLRIPSEALALTWQDVDIPGRRFIVRASKTEHHESGGVRVVPMFPELVPFFEEAQELAQEGSTHVLTRFQGADNLRTMFQRYIARAGFTPWPKVWQNLRVSRATELADQFPGHVSAAWLGHSEKIADAFYRQVTDEHFARATGGAESGALAAQNQAQRVAVEKRRKSHKHIQPLVAERLTRLPATPGDILHKCLVGGEGLEPTASSV